MEDSSSTEAQAGDPTPVTTEPRAIAARPDRTLVFLLGAVTLALGWILWPFYGSILWAAIIALLFRPLHQRLLRRTHGAKTFAALVTMGIAVVVIVLPLVFVLVTLTREVAYLYQGVQSGAYDPETIFQGLFARLPAWAQALLHQTGLQDVAALRSRVTESLAQANHWIAAQAFDVGQNTFGFVTGLFITLYLAFFLLRDGDQLHHSIRDAIPLGDRDRRALIETFTVVLRATVKGNLVVATIQGALGGLAFWYLGVHGALLWAVVMAFLSLVPAVGTGLVIVPMVIYLLLTAPQWQGIALAAYGLLVVGLVDNLLRPVLVGSETHMPDYVVLITTLGGIAALGINGFVLGPVIAAMFIAVWRICLPDRTAVVREGPTTATTGEAHASVRYRTDPDGRLDDRSLP